MDDTESIDDIESINTMIEQLDNIFTEMESQRDGFLWKDLKKYFDDQQLSLKGKLTELQERERSLKEKKSASEALIAETKQSLADKAQAMLDSLQELKDAAVAAIHEARKKYGVDCPISINTVEAKESKESISCDDDNQSEQAFALEGKSPDSRLGKSTAEVVEVKPRPRLMKLCRQMNAAGLLNFISQNWKHSQNGKHLDILRKEISIALKSAANPAQLLLNSLKLYPAMDTNPSGKEQETSIQVRRSCLLLMESAAPLFVTCESGGDHPLSADAKKQAEVIAEEWKDKLSRMDLDTTTSNSLEALSFLQFHVTFSISPEFDQDLLFKFAGAVFNRKHLSVLLHSLKLTDRIPGVVKLLISTGEQIDAVHLIQAFQLSENFPPVPLLKAYLENATSTHAAKKEDAAQLELSALKMVINCIEEYSLQSEYPPEPLQRRVTQLEHQVERGKKPQVHESREIDSFIPNKRRIPDAVNVQLKKPRIAADFPSHWPASLARTSTSLGLDDGGLYHGGSERYPYNIPPVQNASVLNYSYQMPTYSSYRPQDSLASVQKSFNQHGDWTPSASYVSSRVGASSYLGLRSQYNTGLPPSSQPYK